MLRAIIKRCFKFMGVEHPHRDEVNDIARGLIGGVAFFGTWIVLAWLWSWLQ